MYMQVWSDLSTGTNEGGLKDITCTPGVLIFPHQISGGIVGYICRGSPDLQSCPEDNKKCKGN